MQYHIHFSNNCLFSFFTEKLTFSLPITRWVGGNTDLPSSNNISKTVWANITIVTPLFERLFNKLFNDTQVDKHGTCGSLVIGA